MSTKWYSSIFTKTELNIHTQKKIVHGIHNWHAYGVVIWEFAKDGISGTMRWFQLFSFSYRVSPLNCGHLFPVCLVRFSYPFCFIKISIIEWTKLSAGFFVTSRAEFPCTVTCMLKLLFGCCMVRYNLQQQIMSIQLLVVYCCTNNICVVKIIV